MDTRSVARAPPAARRSRRAGTSSTNRPPRDTPASALRQPRARNQMSPSMLLHGSAERDRRGIGRHMSDLDCLSVPCAGNRRIVRQRAPCAAIRKLAPCPSHRPHEPIDFTTATSGLDGHHNFELAGVKRPLPADRRVRGRVPLASASGFGRALRRRRGAAGDRSRRGDDRARAGGRPTSSGPTCAIALAPPERTVNLCFERRTAQTVFDD